MSNKSVLITGCSSGIGLASARKLKSRGWRVFATARNVQDLLRLEREEGLEAIELELSDPGSIENCAAQVLEKTDGQIFGVFNNAAFGQFGAAEDLSTNVLRHQFEVNLFGTHDLTRRLIPAMRAAGRGRIVQCSSVLGFVAAPFRGGYCASKFALEALTDSLRLELLRTGIKVVLIQPGPIESRFVENGLARAKETIDIERSPHSEAYTARLEMMEQGGSKRFKLPGDAVAEKLILALEAARPKRRYKVTTPTYLAAGFKRLLPDALLDRVLARM